MMKIEKNWREWKENIKIHNRDCQRKKKRKEKGGKGGKGKKKRKNREKE